MIINAIAEGVNSPTKAELAYKYDILWQSGDEICVQNGSTNSVFTLVSGAGTTEGTFEGDASLTGEVKAVYPASLVSGEDYTWPAVQTTDLVVPLYKPHI